MLGKIVKNGLLVVAGMSLVGVASTNLSILTSNQQQEVAQAASKKVSYSVYKGDIEAVKLGLSKASANVQSQIGTSALADSDNRNSVYVQNFVFSYSSLLSEYGHCFYNDHNDNSSDVNADYAKDWNGIVSIYKHFRPRFSSATQQELDSLEQNVDDTPTNTEGFVGSDYGLTKLLYAESFAGKVGSAIGEWGENYDGVAIPKSSTISKLSAKKTASKKYVKVTGTVKLYKTANYAHIKTYKGYRYAKLTSKHTFSKTIYAPKAKSVKVTVGHYSNGHYAAVTSAKSVRVK